MIELENCWSSKKDTLLATAGETCGLKERTAKAFGNLDLAAKKTAIKRMANVTGHATENKAHEPHKAITEVEQAQENISKYSYHYH
jgi:hypothetical protein